jgi:hypothetical protein
LNADRAPQLKAIVILLSVIMKPLISVVVLIAIVSFAEGKNVCDQHLAQTLIPYDGNAGVDAHYDALKAAGKSAVPCLIANVTNTQPKADPRPIPQWGNLKTTMGDRAVYMLAEITGVDTIKMLPPKYQSLYKRIGVYARDEYLHDRPANRRTLQRKLWRWYRTTYLPSQAQHNKRLERTRQ